MNKNELIARALRQLPYLEKAETQVQNQPGLVLSKVKPVSGGGEAGLESLGLESTGAAEDPGVSLLQTGAQALKKVQAQGANAKLTDHEAMGLEAVIHATGRPALLVQDNTFPDPPFGWEVLEDHRKAIEVAIPSVGVIDIIVNNGAPQQMGTGFVVGRNVLMTNRHVAKTFAKQGADGWVFMAGRSARVDYRREKDRDARMEFRIKSILGVHDLVDLALLELETKPVSGNHQLPPPLRVSVNAPAKLQEHVYVLGYPKIDLAGATPSQVLADIFGTDFGIKRLQPGEYDGMIEDNAAIFSHDASTLNGSSGSCVLSLLTNQVVGLHFSGTFEVRNQAVALWKLINDKMLKGRVEFAAKKETTGTKKPVPVSGAKKGGAIKKAASSKKAGGTKKAGASKKAGGSKKADGSKKAGGSKKSRKKKGGL